MFWLTCIVLHQNMLKFCQEDCDLPISGARYVFKSRQSGQVAAQ